MILQKVFASLAKIIQCFQKKKICIDLLKYMKKYQDHPDRSMRCLNHRPVILGRYWELGYAREALARTCDLLIASGYVTRDRSIPSQLYISPAGEGFLEDHFRSQIGGAFTEFIEASKSLLKFLIKKIIEALIIFLLSLLNPNEFMSSSTNEVTDRPEKKILNVPPEEVILFEATWHT